MSARRARIAPPDGCDEREWARALNDLARHEFVRKVYAEVLFDASVCAMEGWDPHEFPRMIRDAVSRWA